MFCVGYVHFYVKEGLVVCSCRLDLIAMLITLHDTQYIWTRQIFIFGQDYIESLIYDIFTFITDTKSSLVQEQRLRSVAYPSVSRATPSATTITCSFAGCRKWWEDKRQKCLQKVGTLPCWGGCSIDMPLDTMCAHAPQSPQWSTTPERKHPSIAEG